jgi:pimeloyl-ACP methyl ester carboxylesterase
MILHVQNAATGLNLAPIFTAVVLLVGCACDQSMNPELPITTVQAGEMLREMGREQRPLDRPVVVATGLYDPGFVSSHIRSVIKRATGDDRVIGVSFFWCFDFESARKRLVEHVERAWPSDNANETVEVDVIGYSMGGLVARAAAARGDEQRLRIRRLFTIATPHRGADMAPLAFFDRRAIDMRIGSKFLSGLDAELEHVEYEIHAYGRTRDRIVGLQNSAPTGRPLWWVPNRVCQPSHMLAGHDSRILADIARRLRGEEAVAGKGTVARRHEGAK